MTQGAHINQLEIENTKRVRAVTITPAETGLTVIGGNNNQGKTSVLDAIAWALGGERFRPDNPMREGANTPPKLRVTLSNGCVVERSGKNATLKVTDPTGKRAGQQLLNSFVEELALNLPKFMRASDKEKADTLLRIIGVGDQLMTMDRQEAEAYNKLLYHGQPWGNMSGSDQLRVATAIVRRLNPNCAFVLLDKLEQMDLATLREFGAWLEQEGLQAIATRVSTGGECSIIIEDGLVKAPEPEFAPPAQHPPAQQWQKGVF